MVCCGGEFGGHCCVSEVGEVSGLVEEHGVFALQTKA